MLLQERKAEEKVLKQFQKEKLKVKTIFFIVSNSFEPIFGHFRFN